MGPEHIAISPKPLKYQTNSPFDGQSAGWLLEASQVLQDAGLCRDLERNSRSAWTHIVYAGRGRIRARYKLETPPARPPLSAWLPLVRLVWKWHIKQLRFIWVHNKRPGTGTGHSQEVTRHFRPCCFDTCRGATVYASDIFALTSVQISQDNVV